MHPATMVESLASIGVRSVWESTLIAGFLALLLRQMPGLSPKIHFRLWGAGFALAALLPLCPAGVNLGLHRLVAMVFHPSVAHGHAAIAAYSSGVATHGAAPMLRLSAGWAETICAFWALATLFALLRFAAGVWSLSSLLRAARPAPAIAQAMYGELVAKDFSQKHRLRRARLLVAEGLMAPSACGLFGASILLPEGLLESLSEEELEGVLRHEAAHLCRWDDWLTIAARLVRAVLPLAIALPYLDRRMARAREMACDDAALRRGVSRPGYPVCYAACLARLAENSAAQPWQKLAPGLGGESSQLAARVGHILRSGETLRRPGWLRLAVSAVAALGLISGLLAAPALLSFSSQESLPQVSSIAGMGRSAPQLAAPAVTAMLPRSKLRPVRWMAPSASSQRDTTSSTDTGQRVSGTRLRRKIRLQVADATKLPQALLAKGLNATPFKGLSPDPLPLSPQAVFVFWTGSQDWTGGNLVLLFASPNGRDGSGSAHVVFFNI
jgi:beta-lactamase regulating signal transducer with metallopeptidase domain